MEKPTIHCKNSTHILQKVPMIKLTLTIEVILILVGVFFFTHILLRGQTLHFYFAIIF